MLADLDYHPCDTYYQETFSALGCPDGAPLKYNGV